MSPCRKSILAILLFLGAVTNGCGAGFHPEPASNSPIVTAVPAQPISRYAGNWSGTWKTDQFNAPQNGTMTLTIDSAGKMTGQIHDATTQQDGTLTGQLQTTGQAANLTTMGGIVETVVLGGKSNQGGGNYGIDTTGHLGGAIIIPALPEDTGDVNVGAVFNLTRL